MPEKIKILATAWKTPGGPIFDLLPIKVIGIVACERMKGGDEVGWKAYIGMGAGNHQDIDAEYIAANGAKLSLEEARGFFPHLDPETFIS